MGNGDDGGGGDDDDDDGDDDNDHDDDDNDGDDGDDDDDDDDILFSMRPELHRKERGCIRSDFEALLAANQSHADSSFYII